MGFYAFNYYSFLLMLPAVIVSLYAQAKVHSTFQKYSKLSNHKNLTGSEAARQVLLRGGVTDVQVTTISGNLTDHFDPSSKVIRLSEGVYNVNSISAVGVAAHEAGHALQYAQNYAPIKLRSILVPITNFGSRLSMPLILIGLLLPVQYEFIVYIGIGLYSLMVLFQLITLPVEFNASARAIRALSETGILYEEELEGAKKVLRAAAMTYLAATFTALLSLLRLLLIASNRRRD